MPLKCDHVDMAQQKILSDFYLKKKQKADLMISNEQMITQSVWLKKQLDLYHGHHIPLW